METRHYVRLSTKPVIHFETIRVPYASRPYVGIYMSNYGAGAATLESFIVYIDGQPVQSTDSSALAVAVRELDLLENIDDLVYVVTVPKFLPPGEQPLCLIGLPSEDYTAQQGAVLWDALSRISIHVKYSSVYGTVYQADLGRP